MPGLTTPARPYGRRSLDDRILRAPYLVDAGGSATVTADASIHTKGAWTELIASTAAEAQFVTVMFEGSSQSNTATAMLIDIGIGAAASETVLIANCGGGHVGANLAVGFGVPVFVPKGSRISARCQALISADTSTVAVALYAADIYVPRTTVTLGATTASSRGTNMVTTNTYAEVTAATTQALQGFTYVPCGSGNSWSANEVLTVTIGIGAAGSEVTMATQTVQLTTGEQMHLGGQLSPGARRVLSPTALYTPYNIPVGSRLAIKASTGRAWHDGILIGVPA